MACKPLLCLLIMTCIITEHGMYHHVKHCRHSLVDKAIHFINWRHYVSKSLWNMNFVGFLLFALFVSKCHVVEAKRDVGLTSSTSSATSPQGYLPATLPLVRVCSVCQLQSICPYLGITCCSQPIREQYSSHVTNTDQSESCILVTWLTLTNQRAVFYVPDVSFFSCWSGQYAVV